MNKLKQGSTNTKNTSILSYFKSSQASLKEDSIDETDIIELETCERFSLHSLVWGLAEHGWCPGMITEDSTSNKCTRPGSVKGVDEWHLRFLTFPPLFSWQPGTKLFAFNVDKYPTIFEINDLTVSAKNAHKKAVELTSIEPRYRTNNLTDGTTFQAQSESDDEVQIHPKSMLYQNDQNRRSKRKSKPLPQSKQKRARVMESDSEEEYVPVEESVDCEDESTDDQMDTIPDESNDVFLSKKSNKKKSNTCTIIKINRMEQLASTPTAPHNFNSKMGSISCLTPSAQSNLKRFQCSFNTSQNSEIESNLSILNESNTDKNIKTTLNIQYMHEKLNWLDPQQIKDKEGHKRSAPEYNPRSLYVPHAFSTKVTPAQKQWWEIKSDNFDTILCFKVGKFYELYHMDAVIAVRELGLSFMRGDGAHCGFPEVAYSRFADTLVDRGYKIARVEQTETPQQLEQRNKLQGKSFKVVRREVCSIESKGTRNYSSLNGEFLSLDRAQTFLYAFSCHEHFQSKNEIGFCFIDTQFGTFYIGQFIDDRHLTSLRTLLSRHPPAQVLYERNCLPKSFSSLIQLFPGVVLDSLAPGKEFWDSSKTLMYLNESKYLGSSYLEWPQALISLLSPNSSLGLASKSDSDLAIRCLGAIIWCLLRCQLAKNILSLKRIEVYDPLDYKKTSESEKTSIQKYLILDASTLQNLDIIENNQELIRKKGTLLHSLDHCASGMGKRLLRQWICSPLTDSQEIIRRQEAIQDLMKRDHETNELKKLLKSLPDLERLLRKIHAFGAYKPDDDHPDSRAVLYEETLYNKRKINDFISCLNGFKSAINIYELFVPVLEELKSPLLFQLLTNIMDFKDLNVVDLDKLSLEEGEQRFVEQKRSLSQLIEYFDESFVTEESRRSGKIIPLPGVDKNYDTALEEIEAIERDLTEYLAGQKKIIGCSTIDFCHSGRMKYQMEIPEEFAKKKRLPDDYELVSQKKGIRRYHTPTIKKYLDSIVIGEGKKDIAIRGTMINLFRAFDQYFPQWEKIVTSIATLDVLCSLTIFSASYDGPMCLPEFLAQTDQPTIRIIDGRHPMLCRYFNSGDFIPNDIVLGGRDELNNDNSHCLIITGPNMGGKSTLIRQAGAIVILAQMGCHVPAKTCQLTPFNRIFSRLGASDRILAGESTFFVELSETANILRNADSRSLVLLDEFGRGTATFDGTAIASSVLNTIVAKISCLTLFSTHYHSILDEAAGWKGVKLGYMQCLVNEDEDVEEDSIVFLYKLASGSCPKSYGFNVAKLAGIPSEIVSLARSKAQEMSDSAERFKALTLLCANQQDLFVEC